MLQNQGRTQRLTNFPPAGSLRRILLRSVATAACLCALSAPTAQMTSTGTAGNAARLVAEKPAPGPTAAEATPPSQRQTPNPVEPTPTSNETAQQGSTQAPVTVTQPPGVSGYVPVDYLLIFFGAALIAFLATRPGTQEAIKALLKLISGSGSGNPPV
ncbi:hypothetical protein OHB54_46720 (plasmid) [Streptomyces sp. NBC_01007]|nr:hypothetical protein OHB54_46720 [Streptomyces sp. NBC_01007]